MATPPHRPANSHRSARAGERAATADPNRRGCARGSKPPRRVRPSVARDGLASACQRPSTAHRQVATERAARRTTGPGKSYMGTRCAYLTDRLKPARWPPILTARLTRPGAPAQEGEQPPPTRTEGGAPGDQASSLTAPRLCKRTHHKYVWLCPCIPRRPLRPALCNAPALSHGEPPAEAARDAMANLVVGIKPATTTPPAGV